MSNFMNFLYDHYIKAHVEAQPKGDGDLFRHDVLNNELTYTQQKEDLEPVLRFPAVHAFLLGMQAGRELRQIPLGAWKGYRPRCSARGRIQGELVPPWKARP